MMKICVYRFKEAPENLRALSLHGGDEEDVIVGFGVNTQDDKLSFEVL